MTLMLKFSDLAKARKVDGYVIRGGILFKEIDDDLRIVMSVKIPNHPTSI